MNKIFRHLVFLMVFLMAGSAYALTQTSFDLNTPYGNRINMLPNLLDQLDFAASYGLAKDANPFGPGGGSNPFEFIFQSNITGFIDEGGFSAVRPGLNLPTGSGFDTYEFTIVGSIWETSVGLGGTAASFDLAPAPVGSSNFFEIYMDKYDGTLGQGAQSNINSGVGFDDGVMVMRAEAIFGTGLFEVTDTNGNGVLDNQDDGTGSTLVVWQLTFFDDTIWTFPGFSADKPYLIHSQFDGTLNLPPPASANNLVMWDGSVPDFFKDNGDSPFTTNDFLFKLDGFKIFQPVPEPSTLFLVGAGLLGVVGLARRRKTVK